MLGVYLRFHFPHKKRKNTVRWGVNDRNKHHPKEGPQVGFETLGGRHFWIPPTMISSHQLPHHRESRLNYIRDP